ncbi:unnamed protein product, partial [Iphiclides podalirius]
MKSCPNHSCSRRVHPSFAEPREIGKRPCVGMSVFNPSRPWPSVRVNHHDRWTVSDASQSSARRLSNCAPRPQRCSFHYHGRSIRTASGASRARPLGGKTLRIEGESVKSDETKTDFITMAVNSLTTKLHAVLCDEKKQMNR